MKALAVRALVPAALLLSACGEKGDDSIHIALAGPITAANGVSMLRAAQMAVEEINANGGVRGRNLVLVSRDDGASAQTALGIATELARDPRYVAVIGHLNSAASLRAAEAYNGRTEETPPILQISPASSSPQLTHAGEWTFRVTPTDLEFSPVLARAAAEMGRKRAAVLYVNDDYGQGVNATFATAFRDAGGTVVSADPYLPGVLDRGDELDAYLVRAQRRGMEALVIGGQADAGGVAIVRAARRLGFTGPVLGADGMTNAKDHGEIAEGIFVSSAFLPDRDTENARRFVAAYRARHDGALPDHRGAMAYDVVHLLARAIEEAGTDRRALRDYVARIGNGVDPFEGVSGTIAFDENGDVKDKPPALGIVRGGQLVTHRR
jgi:branched-chain amino acid transport system substrate-binding protein